MGFQPMSCARTSSPIPASTLPQKFPFAWEIPTKGLATNS